jgi:hypothetical protein
MFAGGLAGALWLHAGLPVSGLLLLAAGTLLAVAAAFVPGPHLHT